MSRFCPHLDYYPACEEEYLAPLDIGGWGREVRAVTDRLINRTAFPHIVFCMCFVPSFVCFTQHCARVRSRPVCLARVIRCVAQAKRIAGCVVPCPLLETLWRFSLSLYLLSILYGGGAVSCIFRSTR